MLQLKKKVVILIAPLLKARFLEAGFLLRLLGNTLYITHPYCITEAELPSIFQVLNQF
jgi:adenosylmethionine-8-amino-7-oxononanoate aminotransferase